MVKKIFKIVLTGLLLQVSSIYCARPAIMGNCSINATNFNTAEVAKCLYEKNPPVSLRDYLSVLYFVSTEGDNPTTVSDEQSFINNILAQGALPKFGRSAFEKAYSAAKGIKPISYVEGFTTLAKPALAAAGAAAIAGSNIQSLSEYNNPSKAALVGLGAGGLHLAYKARSNAQKNNEGLSWGEYIKSFFRRTPRAGVQSSTLREALSPF